MSQEPSRIYKLNGRNGNIQVLYEFGQFKEGHTKQGDVYLRYADDKISFRELDRFKHTTSAIHRLLMRAKYFPKFKLTKNQKINFIQIASMEYGEHRIKPIGSHVYISKKRIFFNKTLKRGSERMGFQI